MRKLNRLATALVMAVGITTAGTAAAANGAYPGARGVPFQALQSQIDQLSEDLNTLVSRLQSQIDELINIQAEQALIIAEIQNAVYLLERRVDENEAELEALEAKTEFQAQLIDVLNAELVRLEQRVVANADDIQAIILADQLMQQRIRAIEEQIWDLQSLIDANSGDLRTLQEQLVELQGQLGEAQQQLVSKQERVSDWCGSGSSIRVIYSDGSVSCQQDSAAASMSLLTKEATWKIRGDTWRAFYATCPSTHQVVGGGFEMPRTISIHDSYPTGNSWQLWALNPIPFDDRNVKAFARCLRIQ